MARLRISKAATADIRAIRIYSKNLFGADVARRYMAGPRQTLSLLRDYPLAGAIDPDAGENVRGFAYRSHRLFYRVDDRLVSILRILHHAQDARAQILT